MCVCPPEEQHIALYDEILVLSQKIRAMLFQAWTEILLTLFSLNIFFIPRDILFFGLKVNTDCLQSGQHNSLSRSQRLNTPHEDELSDTFELFKNIRVQELYTNSVRVMQMNHMGNESTPESTMKQIQIVHFLFSNMGCWPYRQTLKLQKQAFKEAFDQQDSADLHNLEDLNTSLLLQDLDLRFVCLCRKLLSKPAV